MKLSSETVPTNKHCPSIDVKEWPKRCVSFASPDTHRRYRHLSGVLMERARPWGQAEPCIDAAQFGVGTGSGLGVSEMETSNRCADYENLRTPRDEKASSHAQPTRSLDEVLKEIGN